MRRAGLLRPTRTAAAGRVSVTSGRHQSADYGKINSLVRRRRRSSSREEECVEEAEIGSGGMEEGRKGCATNGLQESSGPAATSAVWTGGGGDPEEPPWRGGQIDR